MPTNQKEKKILERNYKIKNQEEAKIKEEDQGQRRTSIYQIEGKKDLIDRNNPNAVEAFGDKGKEEPGKGLSLEKMMGEDQQEKYTRRRTVEDEFRKMTEEEVVSEKFIRKKEERD
ncbi:hypothetical protein PPACK8108_LOCUS12937 [Phakopsora pachyrhizi]|uniref:Uncharacterized protein n=1 Tax=Phakopsora pachyrhizi TaxID=170000 RepID=A0AAV0B2F1_PHAPC|nr:hypothetical protein PPACK8108_LOCUS12937 [Phakopsora pachyrhizi]